MGYAETLRGDYSRIRPDYTVDQDWAAYTAAEHAIWAQLHRRQRALAGRYGAPAFLQGLERLAIGDRIPDFGQASATLQRLTGWRIVAVPGLIPSDVFFDHLANRRFPVTTWIRGAHELDYVVEPDIFHDFFGHVPLLTDPVFADVMQAYGRKGPQAIASDAVDLLARVYWFLVEFGLIRTADGVRAIGAGLLSSPAELPFSVDALEPNRIGFDVARVMRTDFRIDAFQRTYIVLDDFAQLLQATEQDFAPLYARLKGQPLIPEAALLPGDRVIHRGRVKAAA